MEAALAERGLEMRATTAGKRKHRLDSLMFATHCHLVWADTGQEAMPGDSRPAPVSKQAGNMLVPVLLAVGLAVLCVASAVVAVKAGHLPVWAAAVATLGVVGSLAWGVYVLDALVECQKLLEDHDLGPATRDREKAAAAVRAWDPRESDVWELLGLLNEYREACVAEGTNHEWWVDYTALPTLPIPDYVACDYAPVWAMDSRGNILCGSSANEIVERDAIRAEALHAVTES